MVSSIVRKLSCVLDHTDMDLTQVPFYFLNGKIMNVILSVLLCPVDIHVVEIALVF